MQVQNGPILIVIVVGKEFVVEAIDRIVEINLAIEGAEVDAPLEMIQLGILTEETIVEARRQRCLLEDVIETFCFCWGPPVAG
ncbi:hypothetical protein TNCT_213871 [Trichonephila clavata]|uniref:Uncharacterized protein n=1 Tax=Trichonephila clavata TaxID=2740835 RepID=A0A8X6EY28_TRICU|nr:hypothetical protein TNCT_213871 [Trichonephila clavata]